MLVVALSAFLPWVSLLGIRVSGIRGDGIITLILAIAGIIILTVTTGIFEPTARTPGKGSQITSIVLAALATIVALIHITEFPAIGVYLTLFAGLAWLTGNIWQMNLAGKAAGPTPVTPQAQPPLAQPPQAGPVVPPPPPPTPPTTPPAPPEGPST